MGNIDKKEYGSDGNFVDGSTTKIRILDASIAVLKTKHGQGVRMSDIAKEAGISRQALYLHFSSRADLLFAATGHLDDQLNLERRLAKSRSADTGIERLDAFIEFWGDYVPKIYTVAKALLMVKDTDEAAAAAWKERMQAMREGCLAAIKALKADDQLAAEWDVAGATTLLWTLLSVTNWEQLTHECGWSRTKYIQQLQTMARRSFVVASIK